MEGAIYFTVLLLIGVSVLYFINKIYDHFEIKDTEKEKEREEKENGIV